MMKHPTPRAADTLPTLDQLMKSEKRWYTDLGASPTRGQIIYLASQRTARSTLALSKMTASIAAFLAATKTPFKGFAFVAYGFGMDAEALNMLSAVYTEIREELAKYPENPDLSQPWPPPPCHDPDRIDR